MAFEPVMVEGNVKGAFIKSETLLYTLLQNRCLASPPCPLYADQLVFPVDQRENVAMEIGWRFRDQPV